MRTGALLLFLCASAAAQPVAAPAEFTLQSFVQTALDRSPEVRQARESYEAASYQWKSRLAAAALPTLSFTLQGPFYGHSALNEYRFNVWRLERQDMSARTGLNLNLFNSFQDFLKVRQSRLGRDSAREGLRSVEQNKAFEALRAFYDLNLKMSLQEVTGQNLSAQAEQYRLTEELYRNGMKSISDLLKSETDWRSAELRLASAEAETKSALMRFNILLDRDPMTHASLKAELEPGATALPTVAADLALALAQKPEVLKARLDLDRAKTGVDQTLQGMAPTFAVNATLNRSDLGPGRPTNPNPDYQAGLSLSLPFNFNFATQYFDYRAAVAERKRTAAALAAAERAVRNDLHSAFISLERAYKTYGISAQKEGISNRNLGIVNERYKQGSADVITLAQAQLDYLSARVERAQALNEAFINRALYKLALGDPLW
ncbi:MAG: TolC family protein [Elusimicrobia bacterium]|nr:TolC family protein [Elusimicrobiota bacterium]